MNDLFKSVYLYKLSFVSARKVHNYELKYTGIIFRYFIPVYYFLHYSGKRPLCGQLSVMVLHIAHPTSYSETDAMQNGVDIGFIYLGNI